MTATRAILFVSLMILASTSTTGAGERLHIRVSPAVAFAPANLVVRTIVERNSANRSMQVVAESPTFYRSSEIPLEGDNGPRVSTVEFASVPSGSYDVTAILLDGDGHPLAEVSRQVNVISNGGGE
jgi:hypothetical protein